MFRKGIIYILLASFLAYGVVLPSAVSAQLVPEQLPIPGTMLELSAAYKPLMIKGLKVDPKNPMQFDFLVSTGDEVSLRGSNSDRSNLEKQSQRLIKYFLACLTIPENELWVNLSPYEKDRITSDTLGKTELGRDLLAQDYILKQLTASLIYPEKNLGKAFWDRVYKKAQELYGSTQVPVNTFNKVWILADTAKVFERNNTAFVVSSHLKVMLDEDYKAKEKHQNTGTASVSSQIVREIILPEIETEVNTGKNFTTIRQIFNAFILASWYKKNLKESFLNQIYTDKEKINGVNVDDPNVKEQIYQRYLQAYKKGVFNYIKEDFQPDGQTVPRKYFSGGTVLEDHAVVIRDQALLTPNDRSELGEVDYAVTADIQRTEDLVMQEKEGPPSTPGASIMKDFFDSQWRWATFLKIRGVVLPKDGAGLHIVLIGPGKDAADLRLVLDRFPSAKQIDVIDSLDVKTDVERIKEENKNKNIPDISFIRQDISIPTNRIQGADLVIAMRVFDINYFSKDGLNQANKNIRSMLKAGGIFVSNLEENGVYPVDWIDRDNFNVEKFIYNEKNAWGYSFAIKRQDAAMTGMESTQLRDDYLIALFIPEHGGPLRFSDVVYRWNAFASDIEEVLGNKEISERMEQLRSLMAHFTELQDRAYTLVGDTNLVTTNHELSVLKKFNQDFLSQISALRQQINFLVLNKVKQQEIENKFEGFIEHFQPEVDHLDMLIKLYLPALINFLSNENEQENELSKVSLKKVFADKNWQTKQTGRVDFPIITHTQDIDVLANPLLLRFSIERLISNAQKAMKNVVPANSEIELTARVKNSDAEITVINSGRIEEKVLKDIFVLDPKKAIRSQGLGLNFAYQAIKKMGGTITIENVVLNGVNKVKCTIELPLADAAMSASSERLKDLFITNQHIMYDFYDTGLKTSFNGTALKFYDLIGKDWGLLPLTGYSLIYDSPNVSIDFWKNFREALKWMQDELQSPAVESKEDLRGLSEKFILGRSNEIMRRKFFEEFYSALEMKDEGQQKEFLKRFNSLRSQIGSSLPEIIQLFNNLKPAEIDPLDAAMISYNESTDEAMTVEAQKQDVFSMSERERRERLAVSARSLGHGTVFFNKIPKTLRERFNDVSLAIPPPTDDQEWKNIADHELKEISALISNIERLSDHVDQLADLEHIGDYKSILKGLRQMLAVLEFAKRDQGKHIERLKKLVQHNAEDKYDRLDQAFKEYLAEFDTVRLKIESRIQFSLGREGLDDISVSDFLTLLKSADTIKYAKKGSIVFDAGSLENEKIKVNRFILASAIYNLIDNAQRFINDETGVITFSAKKEQGKLIFTVSDNGSGIDARLMEINPLTERKRIFDLNASTKKNSGTKTGLGVTEAFYAVNGKISVRNKELPETGAEFILEVPSRDEAMSVKKIRATGWGFNFDEAASKGTKAEAVAAFRKVINTQRHDLEKISPLQRIISPRDVRLAEDTIAEAKARIAELTDEAMTVRGGIDLKASDLKMDIDKQGHRVQMNVDPAMIKEFRSKDFTGLVPVIINITPITGALSLLGMKADPTSS